MNELPYVVECNWGKYWEPIAAFNSRTVAQWYADECMKTNTPMILYRVVVKEDA